MYFQRVKKLLLGCRVSSKIEQSLRRPVISTAPRRMAHTNPSEPPRQPLNKTRLLASELLKKRLESKSNGKRSLIQNSAYLQVLSRGSKCSSPSLMVHSEGQSYLFNCGEGTQRFCYANKIRLLGLEHVFITNHMWPRVSGTLGLSLTLQDIGAADIHIRSADGIQDFFKSTSRFIQFNTGMKCHASTYHCNHHQDSGILIKAIPIEPDSINSSSELSSKRFRSTPKLIAYFCKLPDLPGTLDPKKCREYNVPVGRQLALLKSGQDIVLENGTLVKSVDVCGPKHRGLQFLVIECSSPSHISRLKANMIIDNLCKMRLPSDGEQIDLIVHFSPAEVTSDPDYVSWMNSFHDSCKHLLLSSDELQDDHMLACDRMQYLLRKLDGQIFPSLASFAYLESALGASSTSPSNDLKQLDDEHEEDCFTQVDYDGIGRIFQLNSLDRITIRPHKIIEVANKKPLIDAAYQDAIKLPRFEEVMNELKVAQMQLPQPKDYEPEVVFLGTGSALPSKYRNTSCILVNLSYPKPTSVMLDCGEDSYGQLVRFYGSKKANEILERLELIFVSHHHADHHIGLIRLLIERERVTKNPVLLLLPPELHELLQYHNTNFEDLTSTYEVFLTNQLKVGRPYNSPNSSADEYKANLLKKIGHLVDDIKIIPVQHCINSFAVLLDFKIGQSDMKNYSIAYSGDARPSESFAALAAGCDLLIHEATFDHRSTEDARTKKHCTSSEAIEVSRRMNAKFTILTHFSQRLAKIPYFTPEFDEKIGFAFDNMVLKCPTQLSRLPILKPILGIVFKDFLEDIDMRYDKLMSKQRLAKEILKSTIT